MKYIHIDPTCADEAQKILKDHHWVIESQDGGQSEFVGWAYMICWTKAENGLEEKVWLHYSDRQGVAQAYFELGPAAYDAILPLVKPFQIQPE